MAALQQTQMPVETTPTTPAEMYERFFVPAMFAPWARVLLEYAAPQPGERVLDLACGTGVVARHVAPRIGATGRLIALDLRPGMLAVARSLPAPSGAAIEWREGDAVALDLPADSFDLVVCQQGLQFFSDRAAAVREMQRVLAPGGRLALNIWQGLERQPVFEAFAEAEVRHLAGLA
jgi:ubiquinone/menaquinone biosynthesis C-methylase UbiE